MATEYKKETNKVHEIKLKSEMTQVIWGSKSRCVGEKAKFEVWTHFVGDGSKIEIKIQDKKGKTVEKLSDKVYGDYFGGSVVIPEKAKEELTFTAKLPDHSLELKSGILKVLPAINITNMKWSEKEARRGDLLKLTADVKTVPDGTEATIFIYEYDKNGAHDRITKFPVKVKKNKIEAQWEYEYHEDTDEVPTDEEMKEYGGKYNPPEYFFLIDYHGQRFGDDKEPGLLEFKDWIEIKLQDDDGSPIPDKKYTLYLSDGTEREGALDSQGYAREENVPPGPYIPIFKT